MTDRGRAVWLTERLWELSRDLPVRQVPLAAIREFDQDCWFGAERAPTLRAVAEHARRIMEADLAHPIILSADGGLMDGDTGSARRGCWATQRSRRCSS